MATPLLLLLCVLIGARGESGRSQFRGVGVGVGVGDINGVAREGVSQPRGILGLQGNPG